MSEALARAILFVSPRFAVIVALVVALALYGLSLRRQAPTIIVVPVPSAEPALPTAEPQPHGRELLL